MEKILITGRNIRLTRPIKSYIRSELSKHQRIAKKYRYLKVEILKEGSRLDEIRIKISMSIESKYIRIDRRGNNFYSLFNELQKSLLEEILKLREIEQRRTRYKKLLVAD